MHVSGLPSLPQRSVLEQQQFCCSVFVLNHIRSDQIFMDHMTLYPIISCENLSVSVCVRQLKSENELDVLSVLPKGWQPDSPSSSCSCLLVPSTRVTFLARRYRFIIELDLSPSTGIVVRDHHHHIQWLFLVTLYFKVSLLHVTCTYYYNNNYALLQVTLTLILTLTIY